MKASASAPGKVILTGEHFVVYGEPALVMAINRNVHVRVQEKQDDSIRVTSTLGYSGVFKGEKFIHEKGGDETRKILMPIKVSAQAALNYLEENLGLNIEVDSNIPVAAGLGSSGALAVATIAAIGKLFGVDLSKWSSDFYRRDAIKTFYETFLQNGGSPCVPPLGGMITFTGLPTFSRASFSTRWRITSNTGMKQVSVQAMRKSITTGERGRKSILL